MESLIAIETAKENCSGWKGKGWDAAEGSHRDASPHIPRPKPTAALGMGRCIRTAQLGCLTLVLSVHMHGK